MCLRCKDVLEEDARLMEMIQPKQPNAKKRRPRPKVSRVKKNDSEPVKAESPDVDMTQASIKGLYFWQETQQSVELSIYICLIPAKSSKKTKQTTIDGLFKASMQGSTSSPADELDMIAGPDIFMDQLESMQDVGLDYNFDDPGM